MLTSDFDYDLPPERIAQEPIEPRDAARLLVDRGRGNPPEHRRVADLPDLLSEGDLLVVNEARVLPARLVLRRPGGGSAEVLLLERRGEGWGHWEALARPGRRLRPGMILVPDTPPTGEVGGGFALSVVLGSTRGQGVWDVEVMIAGREPAEEELVAALAEVGRLPLPPYLKGSTSDGDRYQTVFARRPVAAAAPTAGLHLTEDLLQRLAERKIAVAPVELAVGLGTFRPVTAHRVEDHEMHAEGFKVPDSTWEAVQSARRVVAVGTTVVRALESRALTGRAAGRTDLFIRRPYDFGVVDVLMTNFHLPCSSLLMMIDAFTDGAWRDLYSVALAEGYRFLSFGDAMLLTRSGARHHTPRG